MNKWVTKLGLAAALAGLSACTGGSSGSTPFCTSVASVQLQSSVISAAASTVNALHNNGQLPDSTYATLQTDYAKWAVVDKSVVDALVAWNDAGPNSTTPEAAVASLLANMNTLYADFQNIFNTLQSKGVQPMQSVPTPTPITTCSYTDAELHAMYPPAWPTLK